MKAFIYDMDGVIADTEPVHMQAEQHVMKKMGRCRRQVIQNW